MTTPAPGTSPAVTTQAPGTTPAAVTTPAPGTTKVAVRQHQHLVQLKQV